MTTRDWKAVAAFATLAASTTLVGVPWWAPSAASVAYLLGIATARAWAKRVGPENTKADEVADVAVDVTLEVTEKRNAKH